MSEHDPKELTQDKFAEINDEIGKVLEKFGIKNALLTYVSPQDPNNVIIFYNAHFYDAAKLLSKTSNTFKDKIETDLSGI